MKNKGLFLAPVMFVVAVMSRAQVSTAPATANPPGQAEAAAAKPKSAPAADTLTPGTLLEVELSKSLDARKIKPNDRVEAKTATDMLAHGRIMVPRNTRIIGHVTEAKARSKGSPDSTVGITFDRMLLKDGRELPLQLSVQAIARPLQFWFNSEGNMSPANRQGGLQMPGQRPLADASTSGAGTANLPSSYPGDLAPIRDPMEKSSSTGVPLSPTSKGVVGIKGLSLDTSGPAAVLSSSSGNVHLDSGTQLILRVQ